MTIESWRDIFVLWFFHSGLDPAGPCFRDEGFEFRDNGPDCRLDPTDAIFVDVIHTDANEITGLGQMLQVSDQFYSGDFFVNVKHSQGYSGILQGEGGYSSKHVVVVVIVVVVV